MITPVNSCSRFARFAVGLFTGRFGFDTRHGNNIKNVDRDHSYHPRDEINRSDIVEVIKNIIVR